jgi:prepilin-type N-terminal cleavage/methylation domain-containing protein
MNIDSELWRKVHPTSRSDTRAFTLIELLVVVGIIAILVAVSFAYISSAMESGRRSACLGNLRQIGIGLQVYAGEHNEHYPYIWDGNNTWDNLLIQGGYETKDVFSCPDDTAARAPGNVKRSYAMNGYISDLYNDPASVQGLVMAIKRPIILAADRGQNAVCFINSPGGPNAFENNDCINNHNGKGANYIYTDLHAVWSTSTGNYTDANEATWESNWSTQ